MRGTCFYQHKLIFCVISVFDPMLDSTFIFIGIGDFKKSNLVSARSKQVKSIFSLTFAWWVLRKFNWWKLLFNQLNAYIVSATASPPSSGAMQCYCWCERHSLRHLWIPPHLLCINYYCSTAAQCTSTIISSSWPSSSWCFSVRISLSKGELAS